MIELTPLTLRIIIQSLSLLTSVRLMSSSLDEILNMFISIFSNGPFLSKQSKTKINRLNLYLRQYKLYHFDNAQQDGSHSSWPYITGYKQPLNLKLHSL